MKNEILRTSVLSMLLIVTWMGVRTKVTNQSSEKLVVDK